MVRAPWEHVGATRAISTFTEEFSRISGKRHLGLKETEWPWIEYYILHAAVRKRPLSRRGPETVRIRILGLIAPGSSTRSADGCHRPDSAAER
jgi:hypothetical protein